VTFEAIGLIVIADSISQITGLSNIELTGWVFQNVNPKHGILAPQVGLEPTTLRLTAECSAIELLRNTVAHGPKSAVRE
jgi:hypothetical protein